MQLEIVSFLSFVSQQQSYFYVYERKSVVELQIILHREKIHLPVAANKPERSGT
jgi:hypothetical protein